MSLFNDIWWSGLWSGPCASARTVQYEDDNDSDRLITWYNMYVRVRGEDGEGPRHYTERSP